MKKLALFLILALMLTALFSVTVFADAAEGGEETARKRRRPNNYRRYRKPKQGSEG